jgi:valyl-tRNA synthetase
MLEKTYRPQAVEQRIYDAWEGAGVFECGRSPGRPYSIVIPPPNVTGSLHMGHALNNTLQDVMVRLERMRGRDVLWQPGTDHAGIATQMVVERMLAEEQQSRHGMGRAAFIERVWQWKAESGGTITRQLRRLGASCDWRRERFTMDDGLSAAVRKVFVELHRQGLIYKDKRLVNWDPKLGTAISDLEVQNEEVKGKLWHFRYPIEGEPGRFIAVATTRPETMLGDTGVAVHPSDERYRDLVGKHAVLPLVGRRIPIVADEHADPETGSGAVKITPAHDFNDFEVGRRHGLEMINVLDAEARINENAPEPYRGLDRFEARERIVADLEAQGLVEKIDDHVHMVPYGDRGGVPIEPWLTEQWYVDAAELAKEAIRAVEDGRTVFVPKQWEKTYFDWMRNIQPWCVSRQLWWGHQIPAWYGPDGHIFVEDSEADAARAAERHYGRKVELSRDEDVLDTWFSSALWPFSTLGWPAKTAELERYYPTDLLITGFDIIFFWVARMMMMGLKFMGEVPFRTVYINALVRDEKGQKMSKSKGNAIDPLELIDTYGADALRFTMTALAVQGRNVKPTKARVEGYRNFATKLWNAARFCELNGCLRDPGFDPTRATQTVNRWLAHEVRRTQEEVTAALESYRFNDAANALYQFVWGGFCDWYLEFIKPVFAEERAVYAALHLLHEVEHTEERWGDLDIAAVVERFLQHAETTEADHGRVAAAVETRAAAAWALEQILRLLHPFMPFVTEELWRLTAEREGMLARAAWPTFGDELKDDGAAAEMDWVIRLISAVRSIRAEMNVPAGARIPLLLRGASEGTLARLEQHRDSILRLARLERAEASSELPPGSAQLVLDEATLALPLADVIDLAREKSRLDRELEKAAGDIERIRARLSNQGFVGKAPEHVIEAERERQVELEQTRARLGEALARLG